jgi:hypothetical protein
MGPRAVLDAAMKRKIPSPRRESNPRTRVRHKALMGEMRNTCNILIGKLKKGPLCTWEDNIKSESEEVGCGLNSSVAV